jgi:hypothetical protein
VRARPPALAGLLSLLLAGCAVGARSLPAPAPEQPAFLAALGELCGRSFAGSVVEAPEGDTTFRGHRLVMHVSECSPDRVVIPVQVGEDRSRTWVVERVAEGVRLTHIHLRADGTEDDNSRYGGTTRHAGTAWRQDFPADTFSIRMAPGRATQTWTLEMRPGESLDYSLYRAATGLRYRFRFDLARPLSS